VANAVTAQVLGSCAATVPLDGVGTFQVTVLSQLSLESTIKAEFESAGIVLLGTDSRSQNLCYAAAVAVTERVNGDATITGSWSYAAGAASVQ